MNKIERIRRKEEKEADRYPRRIFEMRELVRKRLGSYAHISNNAPFNVARKIVKSKLTGPDMIELFSIAFHKYFLYHLNNDAVSRAYATKEPIELKTRFADEIIGEPHETFARQNLENMSEKCFKVYQEKIDLMIKLFNVNYSKETSQMTKSMLKAAQTFNQFMASPQEKDVPYESIPYKEYERKLKIAIHAFKTATPENDVEYIHRKIKTPTL